MAFDVIDLLLEEPPDGWNLQQFDRHIDRLVNMYKGCYLSLSLTQMTLADKLHERIWVFRDERVKRFPLDKDKWLLIPGSF
jgi:hypothetical protein